MFYRLWLTYPTLQDLTIVEWRVVAILAAAIFGAAFTLVKLPTFFSVPAILVALFFGGAWAGLSAPHDVPTTFVAEFVEHLRVFWREVVLLSVVSLVCSLGCAHLLRRRRV
jgi:hypothetical protein